MADRGPTLAPTGRALEPPPVIAADRRGPRRRESSVHLSQDGDRAGRPRPPADGDLVRVVDRDACRSGSGSGTAGRRSACGCSRARPTRPGLDFWNRRIDLALALRREMLGLDEQTNAYRVVHAEGDGLSGLIVDRFDDVLSVEIFSLGMYQRIGPILDSSRPVGDTARPRPRR